MRRYPKLCGNPAATPAALNLQPLHVLAEIRGVFARRPTGSARHHRRESVQLLLDGTEPRVGITSERIEPRVELTAPSGKLVRELGETLRQRSARLGRQDDHPRRARSTSHEGSSSPSGRAGDRARARPRRGRRNPRHRTRRTLAPNAVASRARATVAVRRRHRATLLVSNGCLDAVAWAVRFAAMRRCRASHAFPSPGSGQRPRSSMKCLTCASSRLRPGFRGELGPAWTFTRVSTRTAPLTLSREGLRSRDPRAAVGWRLYDDRVGLRYLTGRAPLMAPVVVVQAAATLYDSVSWARALIGRDTSAARTPTATAQPSTRSSASTTTSSSARHDR